MRKTVFLLIVWLLSSSVMCCELQARKKEKSGKDEDAVKAVLFLNGNQTPGRRTVDGYLMTPMLNDPDYIEISDSPKGERTRYISEDIDSLVIMDDYVYVKRRCRSAGLIKGTSKVRWVRRVYEGQGIDVYCAYFVNATKINNTTIIETPMNWYVSIADDIAMYVSGVICGSPYYTGVPDVQKAMLSHYFGKTYGYTEFASRVKAGEFDDLMEAVKAWEREYASSPVLRGKLKENEAGIQTSVTKESASAKVGWKRMNTDVSAAAAIGLRWYFSRAAGLWMEGGYNTGYVSAGLTFRF